MINPDATSFDIAEARPRRRGFFVAKRAFDLAGAIILLLIAAPAALALLVINPIWNPGPLFFIQPRMGRDCRAFGAIKFRTMTVAPKVTRGADDPLELDRITRLGALLRKTRIDELPQAINVLRGQMSLIGPRPDYFSHARVYLRRVPGYRERHIVRPGITGLAQVDLGYAQGVAATGNKVAADLAYIREASFALDARIVWRTLCTIFGRKGA